MADDFNSRRVPPTGWSQAFASMPLETPPSDAWSRIAKAMPGATPRRRRSTTGWAIAATLAVATGGAWLALSAWRETPTVVAQQDVAGPAIVRTHGDRADASGSTRTAPQPAASSAAAVVASADTNKVSVADVAAGARSSAPSATVATIANADRASSTPRDASTTSPGANAIAVPLTTNERAIASTDATAAATTSLDDLRAESARLEALVAYARDERMQSAAAAMLTGDVDDRLHLIDAALSQSDLADADRLDLWTRRVDALRELAGLEGTQRWLAAHGESYEDALARVD